MVKQGGGSIVNVVTIPNAAGFALASAHGAAYLGVLSLGQVAAREYAALGVRVHSIGPESMGTPMAADAAYSGSITSPNPVRCLITPEDVASLTTFLCSDEASTMTGGHYPLDERFNAR